MIRQAMIGVVLAAFVMTAMPSLEAGPLEVLFGEGDCAGNLVRIGTNGYVDPHYSVPLSEHEGLFLDLDEFTYALFLFEGSPEAQAAETDSSSGVVPYYLSGETNVPHEYCEAIACDAMAALDTQLRNLSLNGDPEPIMEEVKETIGTECLLAPERPGPAQSGP